MIDLQDIKFRFDIVGNSPALNYALTTAEKVASTDLTVLIMGESGTGKEVFSKIIHQLSPRKSKPFIAINCGAIPEGTIDSELFGHEKGSFTGAVDKRKGYFETVSGGTIFLDEIGEMPLGTQARLLRILQSGEYIKVGSSTVEKTDVRVVAATNVNLLEMVQKGKFREDLYYRLNTVPIEVPPLRNRGEDILMLFRKFAYDFCERNRIPRVSLSHDAENLLLNYRWPGNIRQLKSVAEQVHLLANHEIISAEELMRYLPQISSGIQISSDSSSFGFQQGMNTELMVKMLIDIKQDITDLKRALLKISANNFSNFSDNEFVSNAIELPQSTDQNHYQPQISRPNKVIEIENKQNKNHQEDFMNLNLADMEKSLIIKAMERYNGIRRAAAKELGISERTLYRKIIDYDIKL